LRCRSWRASGRGLYERDGVDLTAAFIGQKFIERVKANLLVPQISDRLVVGVGWSKHTRKCPRQRWSRSFTLGFGGSFERVDPCRLGLHRRLDGNARSVPFSVRQDHA
jgi:hypothetical protein